MPLSRSMIALTAVLAVLAAGLLIGLSQWSAHLEQGPNAQAQSADDEGPDLAATSDETSNAEPSEETSASNATDAAASSEDTSSDDASTDDASTDDASVEDASPPTDEQTASDEATPSPDDASETMAEETSDELTQTESAEPAEPAQAPQPDPTLGDPDAPVTIVEFAEFYCPYCAKFMWETFPQLEETYIETGQVRYVFRNLTVHGMASIEAAIAGECAHDQDAFWAYSDALFDSIYPNRNLRDSQQLDTAALKDLAADIELDTATFDRCLGNFESLASQCEREFRACQSETSDANACNAAYVDCLSQDPKFAAVMADREALSALIDDLPSEDQKRAERIGTPTFFINGRLLIGAQPFSAFERIIEEELDRASSSP